MTGSDQLLRFIQNNITLLVSLAVLFLMASAWIMFEALRSHRSQKEVFRLRRKISMLEAERVNLVPEFSDPLVLARRWIHSGAAATTSDGGCLVYVDRISSGIRTADVTIRVDGEAALQKEPIHVGDHREVPGKFGTYIIKLYATEGAQASFAIALRSHHKESDSLR